MDKETLSNYGWIVVLVLVLAVMLALATPFGTFIAGAIKSTTAGLFSVNQAALGSAGIDVNDMVFENCDHLETELRNVTDTYTGDTCCKACGAVLQTGQTVRPKVPDGGKYTAADGAVYNPGDEMPEVVTTGDSYIYGDYEYRYNQYLNGKSNANVPNWANRESQNGWGVNAIDNKKQVYGDILDTINGKPITSIRSTFHACKSMPTVPHIPNTVTNMDFAFYGCTSLTDLSSFIIPNSVTTVWGTFTNCTGLTKAPAIPSSVSWLRTTFEGCTSLTADGLPQLSEGLEQMTGTFSGCTNLEDLASYNIPSTVTSMDNTFANCSKLTHAPKIPENVTNITRAFYGCTSLTVDNLPVLPSGLTNMSHTYENCTSLTNLGNYTIPNSVINVEYAFQGCTSLTKAPAIPNSATLIEGLFKGCMSLSDISNFQIPTYAQDLDYLFYGCTALKDASNLIIPYNGYSYIYQTTMRYTFAECTSLEKAPTEISRGVGYIPGLFRNCSSLTGTITMNGGSSDYSNCFAGTEKQIIITTSNMGDSTMEAFAATSANGNVIFQK